MELSRAEGKPASGKWVRYLLAPLLAENLE